MAAPKIAFRTSMQIEGLEELRETLTKIAPNEAKNILRAAVHGLAGRVAGEMKQRVTVLTGEVKTGIYTLRRRGKPNFPVSDVRLRRTDHGLMLEFGTSKTKAQPYIVPAVEQMRPQVPGYYREEFGSKFEKAMMRKAKRAAKAGGKP